MWLVRESVYGFTLPSGLSDWLSVLEPLGFDLGSFIFPEWKCVGGLTTLIAFNGLWPLALMLAVALALTARKAARKGSIRSVALRSLEFAIFISFCVLPSVTRSLFLAFQCQSFGFDDLASETKSYLTASLDIECTGGHPQDNNKHWGAPQDNNKDVQRATSVWLSKSTYDGCV